MNRGRLLVRADVSAASGSGHVMRCLALAQGWVRTCGDVVFAMAETTPAFGQRLAEENCRLARVAGAPGSLEDLREITALLASESPSWIVLDGYEFDSGYRKVVSEAGPKCLVIDDAGGQDCFSSDLVLNQNVHSAAALYPECDPETRLLLGPRYALLRAEFAASRNYVPDIPEAGKKILVTMGGSDPSNFAPRIVPHLMEQLASDTQVLVVVGGSGRSGNAAEAQATAFPGRVKVLRDVRNMADLMADADLAIAGAGTTCWEMCCLGLPAIVVEVADNQRPIARKLDAMGAVVNAGPVEQVDCAALAERAREILADHETRRRMSQRARHLVDGRGSERVLTLMSSGLRIRRARGDDSRMLWEWANDPMVRAASFSSEPIPLESHQQWFKQQMESASARIFIVENEKGEAVGEVRFQIAGKRATLSLSLGLQFRGQGLGPRVLLLGIEELFNTSAVEAIDAYVKPGNERSLELFRSAAFEERGMSEVRGQPATWFVLKRWGAGE